MSRSCSRVTSPLPAFSTLMTSAPNHARSCVQVGPDCTCVKSRMRTPLSAFSMDESRQSFPCCLLLVHRLVLGARRVLARVDPDIDHRGAAELVHGFPRPLQGRSYLRRVADFFAVSAEHLRELAERNIAQKIGYVAALLAVFGELTVADLIHRRVIADDGDVWHAEPVGGLHVERGHAERSVSVIAEYLLGGIRKTRRDRKARTDAE